MRHWLATLARVFVLPTAFCVLPSLPAGAADMAKEERQVGGFHTVVLKTVGDLQITRGEHESLVVEAEATVLPKLGTEVRGGILYIESKASPIITQQPIRFTLTVRQLQELRAFATGAVVLEGISGEVLRIEAAGSSNISGSGLDLGELRATLSGSGNVALEGRAKRQEVRLSGAGRYSGANLAGERVSVKLSGAGNASVNAAQTLDVDISGAGDVRYSGNPTLSQKIAGAGSVKRSSD